MKNILKVGDVVDFTAEITLKECPKDRNKWKQTFNIYPVGISEMLTVEVDMHCDCPCEHSDHHVSYISFRLFNFTVKYVRVIACSRMEIPYSYNICTLSV